MKESNKIHECIQNKDITLSIKIINSTKNKDKIASSSNKL